MNLDWKDEFPTEPGEYWFYGDPYMGAMGRNYQEDAKPDLRMYLIKVIKISNGFIAVIGSGTFSTTRFDKEKKRQGWIGRFAKATLPDPPTI